MFSLSMEYNVLAGVRYSEHTLILEDLDDRPVPD